jgi:hypothetical protein
MELLYFLRITDESGTLSLTHWFVAVAVIVYWRHHDAVAAGVVAAAVANYAYAKKALPFSRLKVSAAHADAALARDHDLKRTQVSADVAATTEAVAKLARIVQELATPERLKAVQEARTGAVTPQPARPTRL